MTLKKFTRGKDSVWVNMDLVSHFLTDSGTGTVLMFVGVLHDEPLYICVKESPEEVARA